MYGAKGNLHHEEAVKPQSQGPWDALGYSNGNMYEAVAIAVEDEPVLEEAKDEKASDEENYETGPCAECEAKGFVHLSDMVHMIRGDPHADRTSPCFFCTPCLLCSGSGAIKVKTE